jgi:hypothetical protein
MEGKSRSRLAAFEVPEGASASNRMSINEPGVLKESFDKLLKSRDADAAVFLTGVLDFAVGNAVSNISASCMMVDEAFEPNSLPAAASFLSRRSRISNITLIDTSSPPSALLKALTVQFAAYKNPIG